MNLILSMLLDGLLEVILQALLTKKKRRRPWR